jgi:hypothetical protein
VCLLSVDVLCEHVCPWQCRRLSRHAVTRPRACRHSLRLLSLLLSTVPSHRRRAVQGKPGARVRPAEDLRALLAVDGGLGGGVALTHEALLDHYRALAVVRCPVCPVCPVCPMCLVSRIIVPMCAPLCNGCVHVFPGVWVCGCAHLRFAPGPQALDARVPLELQALGGTRAAGAFSSFDAAFRLMDAQCRHAVRRAVEADAVVEARERGDAQGEDDCGLHTLLAMVVYVCACVWLEFCCYSNLCVCVCVGGGGWPPSPKPCAFASLMFEG